MRPCLEPVLRYVTTEARWYHSSVYVCVGAQALVDCTTVSRTPYRAPFSAAAHTSSSTRRRAVYCAQIVVPTRSSRRHTAPRLDLSVRDTATAYYVICIPLPLTVAEPYFEKGERIRELAVNPTGDPLVAPRGKLGAKSPPPHNTRVRGRS